MSERRTADTVVRGLGILGVIFAIWMVLPSGETTVRLPKTDATPKKTEEPGGDMPSEALNALYPETVIMVDKKGEKFWTPVDRWRSWFEAGARFVPDDKIEVEDGEMKRFSLTGKEANALMQAGRFGNFWRLHGERRKVSGE